MFSPRLFRLFVRAKDEQFRKRAFLSSAVLAALGVCLLLPPIGYLLFKTIFFSGSDATSFRLRSSKDWLQSLESRVTISSDGLLSGREEIIYIPDPAVKTKGLLRIVSGNKYDVQGTSKDDTLVWEELTVYTKSFDVPGGPIATMKRNSGALALSLFYENAKDEEEPAGAKRFLWSFTAKGLVEQDVDAGKARLIWPIVVPTHLPLAVVTSSIELPIADVPKESIYWSIHIKSGENISTVTSKGPTSLPSDLSGTVSSATSGNRVVRFETLRPLAPNDTLVLVVEWPGASR